MCNFVYACALRFAWVVAGWIEQSGENTESAKRIVFLSVEENNHRVGRLFIITFNNGSQESTVRCTVHSSGGAAVVADSVALTDNLMGWW